MRVGGPYSVTVAYSGTGTAAFAPETVGERRDQSRRRDRPQLQRQEHRGHRDGDGDGGIERGVQLGPHRRGDVGQPRDAGDAADRVRPHQRLHPPDAAELGDQLVRRRRQPHEQHDGQRRGLQQLVRPRRPARRAHRRRADLDGSHRTGAGEHRALRHAPGQLRRRQRRHRDPQGHQLAARVGLLPLPQRQTSSAPKRAATPTTRARSIPSRPACWVGAPIVKNRLFVFGNFENEKDARPLYTSAPTAAARRSAATSPACWPRT